MGTMDARHYLLAHPPSIPVLGDVEIVYHDLDGWHVDNSHFLTVYVGPVSLYIRYGGGPMSTLIGPFLISQWHSSS